MINFDNAASGFFKPHSSVEAAYNAMRSLSVNGGRSSHNLALEAEKLIFSTRKIISETFNNGSVNRVIFTSNCTEALNFAVLGRALSYGEIVTTVTEHNSVLRPLYHLEDGGVKLKFAGFSDKPYIQTKDLLPLVTKKTDMVVMNAVSNVTGYKNEYEKIGRHLKRLGIPLVVDGAQAGGHTKIDMKNDCIDCLCLAGHKGLYSIQGVGVLLFNESFDLDPIKFGGSGTESFMKVPSSYPERLEAGTLALPAIASLGAGIKYLAEKQDQITRTLYDLTETLVVALRNVKGVTLYSEPNPYGIVSFSLENADSITLSRYLSEKFDVAVRGGFHCAPKLHEALNTSLCGLTRASLSPFNRESEIADFIKALEYIIKTAL